MTSPTTTDEHGLGRIYAPDSRDADYPLRSLIAASAVPLPAFRLWMPGPALDQGSHPFCVGFGCRDWLSAEPNSDHRKRPAPTTLYKAAQKLDGMPMPHDGSSVRAGLQALQNLKRVSSYHWSTQIQDVVEWVLGHGTLIVGTEWREDMFRPDANGLVSVTGAVAGGHCYLCIGADTMTGLLRFQNSWSEKWGDRGCFSMRIDDFATLLAANGEAAAALEHAS